MIRALPHNQISWRGNSFAASNHFMRIYRLSLSPQELYLKKTCLTWPTWAGSQPHFPVLVATVGYLILSHLLNRWMLLTSLGKPPFFDYWSRNPLGKCTCPRSNCRYHSDFSGLCRSRENWYAVIFDQALCWSACWCAKCARNQKLAGNLLDKLPKWTL